MNIGTRISRGAVCALLGLGLAGSAQAARLHFGQTNYTVSAGGSFPVQVYLDMNEAVAGDQMPVGGLFSMGIKVTFDPLKASVQSVNDIVIPAEINTDGSGGTGFRAVGPGIAQAAGVIPGLIGYTNALMATVTLTGLSTGTYQLGLALCYAGTMNNFSETGNSLDWQITNFVPATVQVKAVGKPVISGLVKQTNNVMRITFANTNFTAAFLAVQSATSLYPVAAWTSETGVAIMTNSPGRYQADLPPSSGPIRFYRIKATP